MQKKRMQNKKEKRKRTLTVKIILNINCKNKKIVLPNITFILNVHSENGIILPEWVYVLRAKNNVNFTKSVFLKQGCVLMRKLV